MWIKLPVPCSLFPIIWRLELIAHRGFSAITPENTIAAFTAALASDANSIEFDVQLSAEGVPIIFHDQKLDRITGTSGIINEKFLTEIQQLEAGKWFDEKFSGEKIPTLAEALKLLKSVDKFLYFDIKPYHNWPDYSVEKLIELLLTEEVLEKCIITSFNELILQQCQSLLPQIKLGYFLVNNADFLQQLNKAKKAENAVLSSYYKIVLDNPSIVEKSREQDIDIVAWTVDNREDFEALVKIGVKRIITNSLLVK